MTTLHLYDTPAQGIAPVANLQGLFDSWRRSKRAIGGYYMGKMAIRSSGISTLTDYYENWIGCKIIERTYGMTSYEGIVFQLDLVKNGINYRRTLNPQTWQNRIQVKYTDASDGDQETIAYSENTDSSAIYGEMEYTYVLGKASSTGATALRDRALIDNAWPRSRIVGSIDTGSSSPPLMTGDGLYITTIGFHSTINWQEYVSSSTGTASSLLSTLVGLSEFVSTGRIETNSLSVGIDGASIPQRLGDTIEFIIKQGDSSGNIWKGGVYADQEFIYEQAPTTVDYILKNGALYDIGNNLLEPALVEPGFYVRDVNSPTGGMLPPGTSNIWDDPQVSYCDEVEFVWPDTLRLKFPGESLSVETVAARVRAYGPPSPAGEPVLMPPGDVPDYDWDDDDS